MLWNLTISAQGISALVVHAGVPVVLEVMRSHGEAEEVVQNALGVLRNISDDVDGQAALLRTGGLPLLLATLSRHARCDGCSKGGITAALSPAASRLQRACTDPSERRTKAAGSCPDEKRAGRPIGGGAASGRRRPVHPPSSGS